MWQYVSEIPVLYVLGAIYATLIGYAVFVNIRTRGIEQAKVVGYTLFTLLVIFVAYTQVLDTGGGLSVLGWVVVLLFITNSVVQMWAFYKRYDDKWFKEGEESLKKAIKEDEEFKAMVERNKR
mgnify:CR=1 FL=1|jgi:hypothetical protein